MHYDWADAASLTTRSKFVRAACLQPLRHASAKLLKGRWLTSFRWCRIPLQGMRSARAELRHGQAPVRRQVLLLALGQRADGATLRRPRWGSGHRCAAGAEPALGRVFGKAHLIEHAFCRNLFSNFFAFLRRILPKFRDPCGRKYSRLHTHDTLW